MIVSLLTLWILLFVSTVMGACSGWMLHTEDKNRKQGIAIEKAQRDGRLVQYLRQIIQEEKDWRK